MEIINEKRRLALRLAIAAGAFSKYTFAAQTKDVKESSPARAVNIESFGAIDEENATEAIQKAIDRSPVVWVPPGRVYLVDTLIIPSNRRLIVDGTLRRIERAPSDSYMIVNADMRGGNTNIVIEGNGELDGNADAQSGDRQGLIRFVKPVDCAVRIKKAGNNRYSGRNPTTNGQGCIVFVDANRSHISVRNLSNWQREGLFIDGASTGCSITRVTATGDGLNSWSAVSISGAGATKNRIADISADNCGASSIVCDSTYSEVDTVSSRNNQFHNGVNFGHAGKPATGTRGKNITVMNAGQAAKSGSSHCGIQVGGGTTDMELSNINIDGAFNHCIQISDGATKLKLNGNNRLTGARHGSGLNAYGADQVEVSGTVATGNNDYGIDFNSGKDCVVSDSDLRGNKLGGLRATGARLTVRNTPCRDNGALCTAG